MKIPEAIPTKPYKESTFEKFKQVVFKKKPEIKEIVREPTSGGIVFRLTPDQKDIEILLIQDSKNRWTIPKGHIEPGETAKQTAIREIGEEAGLKNIDLKKILLNEELGGLEFLCSIPGCIGGSIKTNAGCFGKCIKDVLLGATIVNGIGEIKEILPEDLQLSYRNSFFPDDWIIISITLRTEKSSRADINKILEEQKEYRIKNQPYNEKTAGSTFKNPEGLKAWELIKKSGCADLRVGGAKVSEKHCNFLINTGKATAADIEALGDMIVEKVKQNTSITLEWEVKKMGINK